MSTTLMTPSTIGYQVSMKSPTFFMAVLVHFSANLIYFLNISNLAGVRCIMSVISYIWILMNKVRITAVRRTVYEDLIAKYENPIEHACDVREGRSWISVDGECPDCLCPSAWESMRGFVEALARGEGNFYDGWMKNPMSAMISCNDGFRPFSFYIEVLDED